MAKKTRAMSDVIRQTVETAGLSRYAISQATGVPQSALSRFVSGERGLSMENLDALCEFFHLELKPGTSKRS